MVTVSTSTVSRPAKDSSLLLWFNEVGITDIPIVGGKNA